MTLKEKCTAGNRVPNAFNASIHLVLGRGNAFSSDITFTSFWCSFTLVDLSTKIEKEVVDQRIYKILTIPTIGYSMAKNFKRKRMS